MEFTTILDSGYIFKGIIYAMLRCFDHKRTIKSPIELKPYIVISEKNLIKFGIYYHKELRIQPEPSTTSFDYDTGVMVSSGQEFFVEMAASYTMNDLVDYMLSFGYVNTIEYTNNRIVGLLKYYIGKYGLDTVLFMMEAVANNIEDYEQFNFNKFESYYSMATTYMNNIRNNCHSTGGDILSPRKRKLFW